MPSEYELIKSNEKEMPDDEYRTKREEYEKTARQAGDLVKKTLIVFLSAFAASFVLLHIVSLFNSDADSGNGIGNYTWIGAEFLLALFFYGIKNEDDKIGKYETDKRILLNHIKNKIISYKLRFWLVMGAGAVFAVLNIICWWFAFQYLTLPPAVSDNILKFV